MKTERMIGILALLQTHGRLTCSYLAKKFEVSVRTIRRDIEDISKAGIPLVTTQGNGGGVAGYRLLRRTRRISVRI
ncbi:MAG: HTH domain-containing protein [Clostridia bacterium]|nr:HTH domain-containing protein [Clostridia bacterium]